MWHRAIQNVFYLLAAFFFVLCRPALGQFGLSGILNPEGSRLFPQALTIPRHPGKPDLRWYEFNWKYVDREVQGVKYRLYFYKEEEWIAQLTIPEIESEIRSLLILFNHVPSRRFYYLLLGSRREFQQINVFNISEGVQGITSTTDQTMAIPYWGEIETFRHISAHELTHQFQVQKGNDLSESTRNSPLMEAPLWFTEGMAEYYSLKGIDAETKQYIRDLLLYPTPERSDSVKHFFEVGDIDFVHVYKLGQAKIDFLEEFGRGTSQKILEKFSKGTGKKSESFQMIVLDEIKKSQKELDRLWLDYLEMTYLKRSPELTQSMNEYEEVPGVGNHLDAFTLSPDGELLAIRQIDEVSGVVSIDLMNLKKPEKQKEVIKDHQTSALSLYFMQVPVMALSNHRIAYIVATAEGPELEIREIHRKKEGDFELGESHRILLHRLGFTDASSPTFSPDEKRLAWIGLIPKGWSNVYTVDLPTPENPSAWEHSPIISPATQGYYSWRTIHWSKNGILGTTDANENAKYNISLIDLRAPMSSRVVPVLTSYKDQQSPEGEADHFVFQSWGTGSSQVHLFESGKESLLTEAKVALTTPQIRNGELYALGLKQGRFHLYKIHSNRILHKLLASGKNHKPVPWKAELLSLSTVDVEDYRPFFTSGSFRLDDIGAYFSTGIIAGIAASASDLMRDYSISGQFSYLGGYGVTNTFLVFNSQRGRASWSLGPYNVLQPRIDNIYSTDTDLRTYTNREYGGVAAYTYPLGAFSFTDLLLRVAGVSRTNYSDPALAAAWEAQTPTPQFMLAPVFRIGYDEILYELFAGPLKGYSALFEAETNYFPGYDQSGGKVNERLRLDLAYYFQPTSRSVIALQGITGVSWGNPYRNSFLVSSDDILRGYPILDARLYGNYLFASKIEFRFPIGTLFNFPVLRGLLAYDYGTVAQTTQELSSHLSSSYTGGLSFNLPPISFALMLSFPGKTAPGPVDRPVVHFVLRYLYL